MQASKISKLHENASTGRAMRQWPVLPAKHNHMPFLFRARQIKFGETVSVQHQTGVPEMRLPDGWLFESGISSRCASPQVAAASN